MRSGLSVGAWLVLILAVVMFRRLIVVVLAVILAVVVFGWALPSVTR